MATFQLTLNTDNEAFMGYEGEQEMARILREAADKLEQQTWNVDNINRIRDINGNRVGFWIWAEKTQIA